MNFNLRAFNRMAIASAIGLSCVVLLLIAFHTSTSLANTYSNQPLNSVYTVTHIVYLPLVTSIHPCANPPSGTVMITGQATVHAKPAQPGVPFILWFQPIDAPGFRMLTTTTYADGNFCIGPVNKLKSCGSPSYWVRFIYVAETMPLDDYTDDWYMPVRACESGKVYTVTAEIGK
jgi:hypothetical protein